MAENDNDNDAPVETEAFPSGEAQQNDGERLREEIAELKEKHLRALAEVENTRRRAERDRLEASQYAVTRFARDMLAVSDNLQRALAFLKTGYTKQHWSFVAPLRETANRIVEQHFFNSV